MYPRNLIVRTIQLFIGENKLHLEKGAQVLSVVQVVNRNKGVYLSVLVDANPISDFEIRVFLYIKSYKNIYEERKNSLLFIGSVHNGQGNGHVFEVR